MSAVLRGRNLPLEQSLGIVADAMKGQLPRHMQRMALNGMPAHCVVVTAFLGNERRLYTIDLALAADRKTCDLRWTRWQVERPTATTVPRVGVAGSGASYLIQHKTKWMKSLFRMIKANDRGDIAITSALTVADQMAKLSYEVHANRSSVGPSCIVAWRRKKGSGCGGHQFYTGMSRDAANPAVSTIGCGLDIKAIANTLMPHFVKAFEKTRLDQPADWITDELKADWAQLPDTPDEKLGSPFRGNSLQSRRGQNIIPRLLPSALSTPPM